MLTRDAVSEIRIRAGFVGADPPLTVTAFAPRYGKQGLKDRDSEKRSGGIIVFSQ